MFVGSVQSLWKGRAATGPEARNHVSDSEETRKKPLPHSAKRLKVTFWSLLGLPAERGKTLFLPLLSQRNDFLLLVL